MKTVLFVHQSADLYGSDKVLLDIAVGIRPQGFIPIVLLPSRGPLAERLEAAGVETHVVNVARLSRAAFSAAGMIRLPMEIASAVRQIDRIVANGRIDIVHSNTLAVLGGAVWAKRRRIPHLWHVHELIVSPKVARLGFPRLVGWLSDLVMCNSTLTQKWLVDSNPNLAGRTRVVWNGVCRDLRPVQSPEQKAGTVTVALVGRINRLKGQPVLIEAANHLWDQGIRNVIYLLVGSPPAGQEKYLDNLRRRVASSPAKNAIVLRDFADDVWSIWDNCDIAVVPSTEPESFGLVAIEAMAAGKPVIATAHGGLADIVVDGETGVLVPPSNAEALAKAIARLADNSDLRVRYGEAGRKRQAALFSLAHQVAETVKCYESMTG